MSDFPKHARVVIIGGGAVGCSILTLAIRVNYIGELGWELHVPMENMLGVYEALWQAGRPYGLMHFVMYAMESMRLEKGYLAWKSKISSEFTALEAGANRFVFLDKPDFIGRSALIERAKSNSGHKLCSFIVENTQVEAPDGSLIFLRDEIIGFTTSGGYGHRTGQSIALGYVKAEYAAAGGAVTIAILGEPKSARIAAGALFDPGNERLKGV